MTWTGVALMILIVLGLLNFVAIIAFWNTMVPLLYSYVTRDDELSRLLRLTIRALQNNRRDYK